MAAQIRSGETGMRIAAWRVVAVTAIAYAVVGWLALGLAVPPSYASPLYPSAGIALAAAVVYGNVALAGVALGGFLVNVVLSASRGQIQLAALLLPGVIAVGAALQAGVGAALLRRFLAQPLALASLPEIARAGLLGALLPCLINPTLATLALRAAGAIDAEQVATTWGTWWVGDTLGALIGAPLTLTLIGRPADDWMPRRRTVGVPLLAATLLLAVATLVVGRWDEDRLAAAFERDADRVAAEAGARMAGPVQALQAIHGAYLASNRLDADGLRLASRWWLGQRLQLRALGVSERVPRAELAAFEARVRAEGQPGYRVFDREGPVGGDSDVVAIRLIEPLNGNAGALGVNVLSVPVAREAVERARDTGAPVASGGFRLTQSTGDETGVVVYQALYAGQPSTVDERRAAFRGVVFATVATDGLLAGIAGGESSPVRWCLVDTTPQAARQRLAGPVGCEKTRSAGAFVRTRDIAFASRPLELRLSVSPREMPARAQANAWIFSVSGMVAAAMLGALLLTVTGRARRIEHAVEERTAELLRQMQERASAEGALRDSEARLRSILDNVPIGVMFLDTVGRIVETNPYLCEMLGRPALLLLRSTLAEISHAEEQAENRQQITDLLDGKVAISRRTMRLLRADGSPLWVRVHLSLLRDAEGRPLRLAGVVEDISGQMRLEASERARELAEAASRAKSEFVSRMSHELRTPLNAMIGFSQLLALDREPPLASHQQAWAQQIQRAGWHLLEMTNDTLDLARIESGAVQLVLKPLDLRAVAAASLSLVDHAARVRRIRTVDALTDAAACVVGDETRLKQVLTNLLSNAVKYNVDGGTVEIASAVDADGRVAITVRDSGLGMTPEQVAALFQPYNRLGREGGSIEGTGIGLVISRRLAQLMDGTLEVASTAGQGSVFTLRMPRGESLPVAPADSSPSAPLAYRRRVVHYIEDNETNVEVMRGILAQRPQIALQVSTMGLDGLTAIRQHRPDLILLDMQLPDISGLELLRHLKNDDDVAGIPVIVVSADATTTRMQEALTHYVTKPVDIARFLETLDTVLEDLQTRWG